MPQAVLVGVGGIGSEIVTLVKRELDQRMVMEDQVWGDYYGELTDPFGIKWIMAHRPAS